MPMLVVITGTPGTGKTAIAQALAKKLDYGLIDIKKIVNAHGIYKIEKKEKVVDLKKLETALLGEIKKCSIKGSIIEGHLACEIKLPADFVFVLRCHPKTLRKRLKERRYTGKKLEENVLAEMLDYCTLLARKNFKGRNIVEIETSGRSLNKCVAEMVSAIKGERKKIDDVDYSKELRKYTGSKHG